MNILITGGLGFIGSNIAKKYVSLGHNVTILTRTKHKIGNINPFSEKVKIIVKDIKDISDEVSNMDVIFHTASTVDNYNIFSDPYLDANTNIIGTLALLEACKSHNPKAKIVYLSTFFVNGNPPSLPATAEMKPNPLGLYGATKLCAEHICNVYRSVYNLNISIARLSNIFGDNEQNNNNKKAAFNKMINDLLRKNTINLYDNGKVKRDYIYVDDVVSALQLIAEVGTEEIYFIGRGESISLRELVDIVLEETGSPESLVNVVAPPVFHNQVGINDFYCDISPLKKLGWEPKVSIRDGIKKVIELYSIWRDNE